MGLNLKYVTKGIIKALGKSVVVVVKNLPTDSKAQTYILITNLNSQWYERSKECFEYQVQFTLQLITKTKLNGDATVILDDLQYDIEPKILDLKVDNHIVKDISFIGSIDTDFDTPNNTINRRLLTYNVWLNNV